MQVGDLVLYQSEYTSTVSEEIGIVVYQVGCADHWLVYWFTSKYTAGYNGCNLELL